MNTTVTSHVVSILLLQTNGCKHNHVVMFAPSARVRFPQCTASKQTWRYPWKRLCREYIVTILHVCGYYLKYDYLSHSFVFDQSKGEVYKWGQMFPHFVIKISHMLSYPAGARSIFLPNETLFYDPLKWNISCIASAARNSSRKSISQSYWLVCVTI